MSIEFDNNSQKRRLLFFVANHLFCLRLQFCNTKLHIILIVSLGLTFFANAVKYGAVGIYGKAVFCFKVLC